MAVTNVIGKQIVDLTSDANYYFEVAPQGDSQSRFVDVTVLDNGTPYTIPGASTIILEGKNAGGYNIFNSCTQEDANVIRIPLTNGVLSFAGVGKYSVAIYSSGTYIISFPFNIIVTEAPYDILAVEASDSYEALNEVIAKAADSNRWIVEDNAPPTVCASGVHKNDLFLNALTGDVYYADTNTSTGVLNWYPLMNTATGRQLNIMEKLYIRYADDDVGTNMSIEPIVGGVGKPYIGFYATVNAATSSDVSTASNYKWSLMRNSIDPATSITYYAQTSTTTPPASTDYSTTLPSTIISGGYLWTKIHLQFIDGTSAEYVVITKNGRSIDHLEMLKDEGDVSHGEKKFRFVYDDPDYIALTPFGSENPQALGWYEFDVPTLSYVLTSDTTVQAGKTYYSKGNITTPISVYNGTDGGFGTPTSNITPSTGKSSISVTTDPTSPNTAKIFNFDFNIRASEWKTGAAITGTGSDITSTTLKDSNTIVGDIYFNTSTGQTYVCTAVTASNSTWKSGIMLGYLTNIADLDNTVRAYADLIPGNTTLTFNINDSIFLTSTSDYYHVRCFTPDPEVYANSVVLTIPSNGTGVVTMTFRTRLTEDTLKVTPVGSEDPNALGWYEKSAGTYVVTSDTTVTANKDYYKKVELCVEIIRKTKLV